MDRVFNFAAGPSTMPLPALEKAAGEMLSYGGTGMSVMEMTHRSRDYQQIFDRTASLLRELMQIGDDYAVLFLQGGATGQFAGVPMNLIGRTGSADYADSGNFAHGAMVEAEKYGTVRCVASTRGANYVRVPDLSRCTASSGASYFYITTNNTIFGTRYPELPETNGVPLVADMSSNILSESYDVRRFGAIIAGAQKNIGPAGFAVVIVRRSLFGSKLPCTPSVWDWELMDKKGSMLNTPPTYAVYMAGLCLEWVLEQGGVPEMEKRAVARSSMLYDVIDSTPFYRGSAEKGSRSRTNVTFFTPDADTDALFVKEAAKEGLVNLKGHRLVNGIRASIYNAMPMQGVELLADFMVRFAKEHS